jgi:SPP1 family predicted phage head-tail adaptor
MRAGKLRDYVLLQKPVKLARNASGEPGISWQNVGYIYANINPTSGDEQNDGEQSTAIQSGEIEMRFRDDVQATWRVVHDLEVLNFKDRPHDPDGKRARLIVPYTLDNSPVFSLLVGSNSYLSYNGADPLILGVP